MSGIKKTKTIKQEVTVGYRCDYSLCSKEVGIDDDEARKHWHHFSVRHEGWGNDSIESLEFYSVCCVDHYMMIIQDVVANFEVYKHHDCDIDGMSWYFAKDLVDSYLGAKRDRE